MELKENKRKHRVTIKDVAKASEVSIATVSYVLNNTPGQSISDETKKKVLQFANLLGYECNVMAKYLATGKTNTVAAVIKDIKPLASPYYISLLTELSRLLYRQDITLKLLDYDDGCHGGAICDAYITFALTEKEFRAFAETKYVPVIAVDSMFSDFLFFRINDNHAAVCEAAKQELGTDKINLLTFELPEECLKEAKAHYDEVTVIRDVNDIAALDTSAHYVTVSKLIYDNTVSRASVKLKSASFALKASAATDAAVKAINRVQASSEEHDIRV